MIRARVAVPLLAVALWGCPEKSANRTKQQLEALQKKKEDKARADKEKEDLAPLPTPTIRLDPPYDEMSAVLINGDGPCPDGFWALLPGEAPGATPEEKKLNAQRRQVIVDDLRSKTYLVKLRLPQVALKPFDAPKGTFTVEVIGSIDCQDVTTRQRIAVSWTDAKAGVPPSGAYDGAEVAPNHWLAPPVTFSLPMKTMAEAKEFEQKNRLGISARVAFKLGKGEVDKKMKKVAKVEVEAHGEKLSTGGGMEDWGAGPLVRGELIGLRVATGGEKVQLLELRP